MPSYPQNVKGIQILDEVVAKALSDTAFRRRLLDDPKAVLRKEGIEIEDDIVVVVHRNTAQLINLVLPAGPDDGERLKTGEVAAVRIVKKHMF